MKVVWAVGVLLALVGATRSGWASAINECGGVCTECANDPFVNIEAFYAFDGVATWIVGFEQDTAEYLLDATDDPTTGNWTPVPGGPWPAGQSTYSIALPTGTGEWLRLTEREVGGWENPLGYAHDETLPAAWSPPPPPEIEAVRAEIDSLLAAKTAQPSALIGTGETLVIYTAAQFLPDVNRYASYWTWVGYSVVVHDIATFGSPPGTQIRAGIKASIQAHETQGAKYFLLVGDANDWEVFDGPLTADAWPGIWESKRQAYLAGGMIGGGQPSHDIIPTFVEADTVRPGANQARNHPYWLTDQPYADVNNDDVMDVVVARWPVTTQLQVAVMVDKVLWYGGIGGNPGPPRAVAYVWDWTIGSPRAVRSMGDFLGAELGATVMRAFPVWSESTAWPASIWNSYYPDLVFIYGDSSHRYAPGMLFTKRVPFGRAFDVSMLTTYRPAFVVAATCAAADWGTTEIVRDGLPITPVCEDFLTRDWFEGAIGWIGPTSGTWQAGNEQVVRYIVEELKTWPSRPVAENWMHALRRLALDEHSTGVKSTARTYAFLGDPLCRVSLGSGPATGVLTTTQEAKRPSLSVAPNPGRAGTTMLLEVGNERSRVDVRVFDAGGRSVADIMSGALVEGRQTLFWDGRNRSGARVSAGVYFVRASVGQRTLIEKVVLLQ